MNILWLTTRPPYPADAGGKIAVYWRIRELAALGHRIHLVASHTGESEQVLAEARSHLLSHTNGGSVFFAKGVPLRQKMAATARLPWGAARRRFGPDTLAEIERFASTIDVVLVDQSGMFPAARQLRPMHRAPEVVFQFADAGAALRRTAEAAQSPQRLALLREAGAYDRLDRCIVDDARVAHVGFVSETEFTRTVASHPADADRFSFHPLPYPFETVAPGDRPPFGSPVRAVFVANFADPGNRVAARWLVEEVIPLLDRQEIRLTIAGRRASELSLDPAVVDVESDPVSMSNVYATTDIAVVPVLGGGGVRLKLLEAIAHRVPVVTTPLGMAGTTFRPNQHLLVASAAPDFAAAIGSLVVDGPAAQQRAERASQELQVHHAPRAVAERLASLLESVRA